MDTATLSLAVAALVARDDAKWLHDALQAVVRLQNVYPVALVGEAADVDPLRRLAQTDRPAYERVMALVDVKRAQSGKPPLVPVAEDRFDKREYMREFMDKKRQRLRKAVDIENFARPERDALRGRARLDFMDRTSARWKTALDARVEQARAAAGGRLDAATMDALRADFWQGVDRELDELQESARRKLKR